MGRYHMNTEQANNVARWEVNVRPVIVGRVFPALRKLGIVCRANFSCCGGCAGSELGTYLEAHPNKIGATYWHRQSEQHMRGGSSGLYLGFGSRHEDGVSNDEQDALDASIGEMVVAELRSAGLNVEWDGTSSSCILVMVETKAEIEEWKRRRDEAQAAYDKKWAEWEARRKREAEVEVAATAFVGGADLRGMSFEV